MNCSNYGAELLSNSKFCSICGKPQKYKIESKKEVISTGLIQHLKGPFDLSVERKPDVEYLHMETHCIHIGFDGNLTGTETYMLKLRCIPAKLSGKKEINLRVRNLGYTIIMDRQ